ncbi:hypothetical protein WG908_03115 [Sphingobium sp. AN641]|uniref:hypothetical protein n=1 Tax=Sphingobium sp. AN641 TaxID=3133443 RepID=UPI0030C3A526
MALTVFTMGAEVPCTIDAEDTRLRVTVHLSGMTSLMAGPISSVIQSQGARLMLNDKSAAYPSAHYPDLVISRDHAGTFWRS